MNDLSQNPFLKGRVTAIEDYTLESFLLGDIAIERVTDIDKLQFAVTTMLTLHGMQFTRLGSRYLSSLVSRYIVKSDYDEDRELQKIADIYGIEKQFVIGCILEQINDNPVLRPTLHKTYSPNYELPVDCSISQAVMLFGALFKIYYNYRIESEVFPEDSQHVFSFHRIFSEYGKHRKQN